MQKEEATAIGNNGVSSGEQRDSGGRSQNGRHTNGLGRNLD